MKNKQISPEMAEKLLRVLKNSTLFKSRFHNELTPNQYQDLWLECIHFLEKDQITYKIVRKPETKEWIVREYVNGKLNPVADYFTDDKQDAQDTMNYLINKDKEKQ
jgi:hypothetical protein